MFDYLTGLSGDFWVVAALFVLFMVAVGLLWVASGDTGMNHCRYPGCRGAGTKYIEGKWECEGHWGDRRDHPAEKER